MVSLISSAIASPDSKTSCTSKFFRLTQSPGLSNNVFPELFLAETVLFDFGNSTPSIILTAGTVFSISILVLYL